MGEGVTGPHPSAKFNPFGFKNVGLEPPKSQKLVIGNFWYIFGQKGYILLSNFYKIWRGRVSQVPTVVRTSTIVALKMWPYGRQNRQKLQFLV